MTKFFLNKNYIRNSLSTPSKNFNHWFNLFLLLLPIVGLVIISLLGTYKHSFLFLICYVFFALIYIRFDLAILLFLAFIPIMRLPFGLTVYVPNIKYIIGLIIFLVWLIKKLNYKKHVEYIGIKNPFNLFVVAFSVLAVISCLYSVNMEWSFRVLMREYIYIFLFFYLFVDIIREKSYLNRIIVILLLLGTGIALIAILQYIIVQFGILSNLKEFIIPKSQWEYASWLSAGEFRLSNYRSPGTFFSFNNLGMYLAALFPIALSLFVYGNNMKSWYFLLSALLMFVGIFVSGSRGSFMSILVGMSVIFIFNIRNRKMLLFVWLLALMSLLSFLISPDIIIEEVLRLPQGLSRRTVVWQNTIDMFIKHPFLGWGLGNCGYEQLLKYGFYSPHILERSTWEMLSRGGALSASWKDFIRISFSAHNIYLNHAVEMGILGVILILYFYFVYFKKAFYLLNRVVDKYSKPLLVGFMATISGNIAHGFFEYFTLFGVVSVNIFLWLIIAMTLSLERPGISGNKPR